jgi:hypothetical protein
MSICAPLKTKCASRRVNGHKLLGIRVLVTNVLVDGRRHIGDTALRDAKLALDHFGVFRGSFSEARARGISVWGRKTRESTMLVSQVKSVCFSSKPGL